MIFDPGVPEVIVFGMVSTRHSLDYTVEALESFFDTTRPGPDYRFILIDNDRSFDPSLLNGYPGVNLLVNEGERSFAENGNEIIKRAHQAGGDAIFMNNDIIFTRGWLQPLLVPTHSVVASTGNQNYQYQEGRLHLKPVMTLKDFNGAHAELARIVETHSAATLPLTTAFKTNFFCVRIPAIVYRHIGLLDTGFGKAGGEDDDYCIRAYLGGFSVIVAEKSFLLHFGGRSSWGGPETREEWAEREKNFIDVFIKKWGRTLSRFLLFKDSSLLEGNPAFRKALDEGGIGGLYVEMMKRDGIVLQSR